MTFGEKLKEARKEAGLSQEQFAEKMSVSRSAIAKWESDKGMPDVNNLKVMAQLLDVSVDYLLDETGLPKSDVLSFSLPSGFKFIVRPSGTEPKLKAYLFAQGSDQAQAEKALDGLEVSVRALCGA